MKRISKEQLARNLARRVELADDKTPEQALGILLYGWLKKRKYSESYYWAVHRRDFLYITEVQELSEYAGVNPTIFGA